MNLFLTMGNRLFRQATAALALTTFFYLSNASATPQKLFNGHDLNGFYTFIKGRGVNSDPKQVFTVQDGVLRISGEEWGCITTDEEFENYHLLTEFRWGEKTWPPRVENARDCGILVHSTGTDGGFSGTWMHSLECQMIEGGTGDLLVVGDGSPNFLLTCPAAAERQKDCFVFQKNGVPQTIYKGRINWWGRDSNWQDVKGFRGARDVEKPIGKWNTFECIADGNRLTVKLNGVVVNQALDAKPVKGRIQIQSEGAEVFFRKIIVKPLRPKLRSQP